MVTKSKSKQCAHLEVLSFGIAAAIIWAISVFILALLAETTGFGSGFVRLFSTMYVGYHASLLGALIGGIWGFIDAFIGGVVFAWLYNLLRDHFHRG